MLTMLRKSLRFVLVVVAVTLVSAGWTWWTPRQIEVDGIVVRESTADAWAQSFTDQWEHEPISIDAGESILAVTPAQMGISRALDVVDGLDLALALRLEPAQGAWRVAVDEEAFQTFFEELAMMTERAPGMTEAGVVTGRALDGMAARDAILEAVRSQRAFVRLPFRDIAYVAPPIQEEASATFGVELAAHSSSFHDAADSWTRARNIALAVTAIDGIVVAPGETFSFSDALGPRTFARGFMPAEELSGGELVTGIGGGICQVATGLFETALRAGLGVVEHHPHSQLPSYASPGFDTAVAWELKDLRIENTLPFHLRIRAVAQDGTLRIQLLGSERGPDVSLETEIERREDGSMSVKRTRVVGRGAAARREEEAVLYEVPARRRR